MTTPESIYRPILMDALRAAGQSGLAIEALYAIVAAKVRFDEDDLRPPNLHGGQVNEPSWKRNVRNTLQKAKDRLELSNFQKGCWRIALGPELGLELDAEEAWLQVSAAAEKAMQSGWEFGAPARRERYQVEGVEDTQIVIDTVGEDARAHLKRAQVERAIRRLNASGSQTGVGTLINTLALEAALVTLHPRLHWSPEATWITVTPSTQEDLPELSEMEEEEDVAQTMGAEGAAKLQTHRRRERNRSLIGKFKRRYLSENAGRAPCQVCGFDFVEAYGPLGAGFIEAHHITALSSTDPLAGTMTRFEDIAFLCANCHRMSHRPLNGRWATLAQLQAIVRQG